MSGVLTAVGIGLQIAGGMINMYRSSPPVSVYRGGITRGFLERWINSAETYSAGQNGFYPYPNQDRGIKHPDAVDGERLVYWLNNYNDLIVDEWGEDSRLDVDSYMALQDYKEVYQFILNEEVHMNADHLYNVHTGEKYIITPAELFEIAELTRDVVERHDNRLGMFGRVRTVKRPNYERFSNAVVARIRDNHQSLQGTISNNDNGDSVVSVPDVGVEQSSIFNIRNIMFFIVGAVLYNLLKK